MGRFTPPRRADYPDSAFGVCVLCGGRLWPEGFLVKKSGKLYCREHYQAKFLKEELDKVRLNLKEEDADL